MIEVSALIVFQQESSETLNRPAKCKSPAWPELWYITVTLCTARMCSELLETKHLQWFWCHFKCWRHKPVRTTQLHNHFSQWTRFNGQTQASLITLLMTYFLLRNASSGLRACWFTGFPNVTDIANVLGNTCAFLLFHFIWNNPNNSDKLTAEEARFTCWILSLHIVIHLKGHKEAGKAEFVNQ